MILQVYRTKIAENFYVNILCQKLEEQEGNNMMYCKLPHRQIADGTSIKFQQTIINES